MDFLQQLRCAATRAVPRETRSDARIDSSHHRLRVSIRVRPALSRETSSNGSFHSCIGCHDGNVYLTTDDNPVLVGADGTVTSGSAEHHVFDSAFDDSATTEEVYARSGASEAVDDVLAGANACIFCFGQTGSGKTYTMLGVASDAADNGIAGLAARDLFAKLAARRCDDANDVDVSFLQVEGRRISDLCTGRKLSLRAMRAGTERVVEVVGLSRRIVRSAREFSAEIERGRTKRVSTATKLNSVSSRSHGIITLRVGNAKLHLVDLAGSERVKESGVRGVALKQARDINLSLFHLVRCVKALADHEAHIPYGDSTLCTLLSDAFGRTCRTTLIATVSPAQCHASESSGTLSFAASCARVRRSPAGGGSSKTRGDIVVLKRDGGSANRDRAATKVKEQARQRHAKAKMPWAATALGDDPDCVGGRMSVPLADSGIVLSALSYGDRTHPLALCLHGHPSDAEQSFGDWLLPALVWAGYHACALDMPGRGDSGGEALQTRSEFNLKSGGAADMVCEAIAVLSAECSTTRNVVLLGYDWGGGVALSMALSARIRRKLAKTSPPRRLSHIVPFHPSFSEQRKGELNAIECKVLLLWCSSDAFHPWRSWKKNANVMKRNLAGTARYDELILGPRQLAQKTYARSGWSSKHRVLERKIIHALTGSDPIPKPAVLRARVTAATKGTDGQDLFRSDNIVLTSRVDLDDATLFAQSDPEVEAVAELRRRLNQRDGSLRMALHGTTARPPPDALSLFRRLPLLSPLTLDPKLLVTLGLWSEAPRGRSALETAPRYPCGRSVLVRAPVDPCSGSLSYMQLLAPSQRSGETYTTPCAVIVDEPTVDGGAVKVAIDVAGGATSAVCDLGLDELLRLNQPHCLPSSCDGADGIGDRFLHLEDGVRCDYASPLCRAKMCEIALALAPIVGDANFDFSAAARGDDDSDPCCALQRRAVLAIRSCLDITTFQRDEDDALHGGKQRRATSRYCKDSAARFAQHGQGHCHTCASVMAAFLYPWTTLLGIDLRYRGGMSIYSDTTVADAPETHQWLDFTCRPSNRSYVCDLFVDDGAHDLPAFVRLRRYRVTGGEAPPREEELAIAPHLTEPLIQAYTTSLYPHGKLPRLCGRDTTTAAFTG